MRRSGIPHGATRWLLGLTLACLASAAAGATTVMPLGDSITSGHNGHASYRYPLWFNLLEYGHIVDLVGQFDTVPGGPPNPDFYPSYAEEFDRDHEGHWGYRTGQILSILSSVVVANPPDIVMIHLGTNDIGQRGEPVLAVASANLRLIIEVLRSHRPQVIILLAQVIPISPTSVYGENAHLVATLNQIIADIAAEESTLDSPIVLVDQHSGFDPATMLQGDGIHPNAAGEDRMAWWWLAALASVLPSSGTASPPPLPSLALHAQPNPFNPTTTVAFDVPASAPVWLSVVDARGRRLRTLIDGLTLAPGRHHQRWDGRAQDGRAAGSGVYYLRLQVGDRRGLAPVTLVR